MSGSKLAATAVILLAAGGCNDHKAEAPPPIRPVLSVVVAPQTTRTFGFAGMVEPRYRANLGFRVLGRIIARDVKIGDVVTKGQRLAALDPLSFELAVRAAQAEVSSAAAQLANASATETRQRTLLQQSTATQAVFDAAQQAREAAAASLTRAQANLSKAQEQLGYTQLRSDFDGVVTGVEAEVGQVVSPGQTVVAVARPDIREAVVDVPDGIAAGLAQNARFEVLLQLDPTIRSTGTVREIAPQSDPTTRTRRARITLDNPPASFRLGTIVTATLTTPTAQHIALPSGALLQQDGKTLVWVVDPTALTVSPRPVHVVRREDGTVEVADGLVPGLRVVTAGVHSLQPGQSVKILDEAPR
jgi:RND family efflux transporter MFP subunit